jgi:hypothetical protein
MQKPLQAPNLSKLRPNWPANPLAVDLYSAPNANPSSAARPLGQDLRPKQQQPKSEPQQNRIAHPSPPYIRRVPMQSVCHGKPVVTPPLKPHPLPSWGFSPTPSPEPTHTAPITPTAPPRQPPEPVHCKKNRVHAKKRLPKRTQADSLEELQ